MTKQDGVIHTSQTRAARAMYLLMRDGRITRQQLMEELGYKHKVAVDFLIDNLALGVPIVELEPDVWVIMSDDDMEDEIDG